MDPRLYRASDAESAHNVWYLSAVMRPILSKPGEPLRMGSTVTLHWAVPVPCSKCPGGFHQGALSVTTTLN